MRRKTDASAPGVRRTRARAAAIIFGAALLFAPGCGRKPPPPPSRSVRSVKAIRVTLQGAGLRRTFSGLARAGQEAALSFRVGGKVEKILVGVGDRVKQGQVLARLDAYDYELEERNIQANLESARAAARNSENDYRRAKALYEENNISRSRLDQAETKRNSDRAGVKALSARLVQARNQLDYTGVRAPFSGFVSGKKMEEFETVAAGQPVLTVMDPHSLKVEVGVPESLISRVARREPVSVKFNSLDLSPLAGTVSEVGVALDNATGTYPVTVILQHVPPEIRPGMAAEVTFTFKSLSPGSLVLPTSAILEDLKSGRRNVWVVEGGRARKREVKTGELAQNGLEIISGLKGGELVVTAGVHRLEEGQQVKILGENPKSE